jgi:hypothetical protein
VADRSGRQEWRTRVAGRSGGQEWRTGVADRRGGQERLCCREAWINKEAWPLLFLQDCLITDIITSTYLFFMEASHYYFAGIACINLEAWHLIYFGCMTFINMEA